MTEKFKEIGICEVILKSIKEHDFKEPSEIQVKAIPLILEGKDVLAGSATGSGKTLVFGCGIIQKIEKGHGIQALILTPTRELAEQITVVLNKFSKYKPLNIISVYGGVSINPQIDGLRDADVVVGTPGRILDHLERRTIDLRWVKILVLDEADRMLDMGFIRDMEKIVRHCPEREKRQTLLFSATINSDIAHLARKYMNDPVEVSAETYVDPTKLEQVYYSVDDHQKFSLLVHLLKNEQSKLTMVFCDTKRAVDFVARGLHNMGMNAMAMHGDYSQNQRTKVLESFNEGKINILVCTEVAARGLDIKGVSHVYNYDIPKNPKDYIHRIGRTARAGKEGKAISIVANRDYGNFSRVLYLPDIKIKEEETPEFEEIRLQTGGGGGDGSRFRRGSRDNQRSRGGYGGGSSRGYGGGRSEGRSGGGYAGRSEGRSDDRPRSRFRSVDSGGDRREYNSHAFRGSGHRRRSPSRF